MLPSFYALNPWGSKAELCYLEGNKITKEGNKMG